MFAEWFSRIADRVESVREQVSEFFHRIAERVTRWGGVSEEVRDAIEEFQEIEVEYSEEEIASVIEEMEQIAEVWEAETEEALDEIIEEMMHLVETNDWEEELYMKLEEMGVGAGRGDKIRFAGSLEQCVIFLESVVSDGAPGWYFTLSADESGLYVVWEVT